MAALLAGLPVTTRGPTVNRLCGSGLDAVPIAARQIKAGEADLIVAGGVESMSARRSCCEGRFGLFRATRDLRHHDRLALRSIR